MAGIFGTIKPPLNNSYFSAPAGQGLFLFLSNIFKLTGVVAGIIMIFQVISAGYGYITANGDIKKTEQAWGKIWQSLIGLIIIASAFVIAGVAERLTGIKILNPVITGP